MKEELCFSFRFTVLCKPSGIALHSNKSINAKKIILATCYSCGILQHKQGLFITIIYNDNIQKAIHIAHFFGFLFKLFCQILGLYAKCVIGLFSVKEEGKLG